MVDLQCCVSDIEQSGLYHIYSLLLDLKKFFFQWYNLELIFLVGMLLLILYKTDHGFSAKKTIIANTHPQQEFQ